MRVWWNESIDRKILPAGLEPATFGFGVLRRRLVRVRIAFEYGFHGRGESGFGVSMAEVIARVVQRTRSIPTFALGVSGRRSPMLVHRGYNPLGIRKAFGCNLLTLRLKRDVAVREHRRISRGCRASSRSGGPRA